MPYQGSSEMYDGRGIRKGQGSARRDFFCDVLGYEVAGIPAHIDTSTVIVMPKDKAVDMIGNIAFLFNGKTARLLDLVTVSYFTENEEIRFGGNIGLF